MVSLTIDFADLPIVCSDWRVGLQIERIAFVNNMPSGHVCLSLQLRTLRNLFCRNIQLKILDLSGMPGLEILDCSENKIIELDLSRLALTELYCYNNKLTELDLSNQSGLTELYCHINRLTALHLPNQSELIELSCYSNQLTELNLSNQPELSKLFCFRNQLTELYLPNQSALTALYCHINHLTELHLPNQLALTELSCFKNQLTGLDLSNQSDLTTLNCGSNQLTVLYLPNQSAVIELSCYTNRLTGLDLSNQSQLSKLNCRNNNITHLNLSHQPGLLELECRNNQLTELHLSNKSELTSLNFDFTIGLHLSQPEVFEPDAEVIEITESTDPVVKPKFGLDVSPLTDEEAKKRREDLGALVKIGKTRGYLTQQEITDHLPEKLVDAELIEAIIKMLNGMGISVCEQAPGAGVAALQVARSDVHADAIQSFLILTESETEAAPPRPPTNTPRG